MPAPAPPPPPPLSFDDGALDFGPPEPPQAAPAAVTQLDMRAQHDGPGLLGDLPPPAPGGHLSLDPEPGMEASHESRGALFDMSSVPEPDASQLEAPQEQVAVAKIALKKVTADQVAKPSAVPTPDKGETPSGRRPRSVVSMVWNVLSAAMLVVLIGGVAAVVLNDGKVDASLSWAKLKSLFVAPRELVAFDISNGLYDTRSGRPVFYVRGEVKNRGQRSGKVKVKADILDGEDLVRSSTGFAGATPSPEDLYAVATAEDLTALATKLAPNATQMKPGDQATFLVAFYEYPPDLKDFRVRVSVLPDDGSTAAR